ncbi:unnamed protein product [Rotaria sp. Silwood1]|nr:unnamed protein product [Rotaria sp. Silwood1]
MDNKTAATLKQISVQQNYFVQNFILVWLDADIDETSVVYLDSIKQIKRIANTIEKFTDPDECIDFITDMNHLKLVLIISYAYACCTIPCIHDIPQLEAIYIFFQDIPYHEQWITHWPKVIGIFNQVSSICESLKIAVRRRDEDKLSVSMVSIDDTDPNKSLHQLDQSFMYTQLLKEIILDLNYDEKSIKDLTQYFREEYADNEYQLKFINEFEQDYFKETPIRWYTRETFLYRMLNYALRIQDVDCIIKMGFFIRDLHNQIKQLHAEQYTIGKTRVFTVYRGQGMSYMDFEKLQNSIGGLISFNNFLSTSRNHDLSFAYADSNQYHSDLIGIFFEITIDTSKSLVPFADLHNLSYIKEEDEILFSMHTIFRIFKTTRLSENNRLWQVQLELTADNDELLEKLTKHMRYEIRSDYSRWHQLAKLLVIMGQFDMAEQHYKMLLDRTLTDAEKARIYNDFGLLKTTTCQYLEAMSFYNKALKINERILPPNHQNLGTLYNNIAMMYNDIGEYEKAFSFHEKSIQIFEEQLPANHSFLANAYNNIAMVYDNKGEYSKALLFFEKALKIRQTTLPSNHPHLASSYNNIAVVYQKMERYSEAIFFAEKTLQIEQKTMPPNHPSLAISYSNIAVVYVKMRQYSKAVFFLEKSIDIFEKTQNSSHQLYLSSYTSIANIYKKMGEYTKALPFYEKSLQIQQKTLPFNHSDLADSYNSIGYLYMELEEYSKAVFFLEKSIEIREKILPQHHPDLTTLYNNISTIYEKMKFYTKACFFCKKTIEIMEKTLPQNHLSLATPYNNIACMYDNIGEFSKALPFHEKALQIRQKSLPPNHPELANSYNNIGAWHRMTKQYPKALLFYEKSLQIREKVLPPNHPHLVSLYTDISLVYVHMEQYSMAYSFAQRSFDIRQRSLPSDHPDLKKHRELVEALRNKCK